MAENKVSPEDIVKLKDRFLQILAEREIPHDLSVFASKQDRLLKIRLSAGAQDLTPTEEGVLVEACKETVPQCKGDWPVEIIRRRVIEPGYNDGGGSLAL